MPALADETPVEMYGEGVGRHGGETGYAVRWGEIRIIGHREVSDMHILIGVLTALAGLI